MTRLWDPRTSASAKAVVARMDARRIRSDGYVLYAYAAVEAWAQAVKAASSTQARAVSKKLGDMALSTVLGRFAFDENGDPDQVFYRLYRWSSGRYQPLD